MGIKLKVITPKQAEGRATLTSPSDKTVIVNGMAKPGVDMDCGNCGARLVQHIEAGSLQGMVVLICKACGSYNELPAKDG